MINLAELISEMREEGYEGANAEAKVCQDIILLAISESALKRNVTVKGGIVMREITKDVRRATVDIDLDFIKYSLEDSSIRRFIDKLNVIDGLRIEVDGEIEELSQQEYRGKRVYIKLNDNNENTIKSKIDLGVHVNMDIEQEEYCFDVCLGDEGASLLINSKEQIFTEKLRSLLRFGPLSTRYKDVFDMHYLSSKVDKEKLANCIHRYILDEPEMRERSMDDIVTRVNSTFGNRAYQNNISRVRKSNWLGIEPKDAMEGIERFLQEQK